jgi:hypothetical protein
MALIARDRMWRSYGWEVIPLDNAQATKNEASERAVEVEIHFAISAFAQVEHARHLADEARVNWLTSQIRQSLEIARCYTAGSVVSATRKADLRQQVEDLESQLRETDYKRRTTHARS